MSNPTEVIVLCEDNLTFSFVRSYLSRCGIKRNVRPVISPHGKGSGFDWVIDNYALQVNAYRLAKARKQVWLIVVVDADEGPVARRLGQLRESLQSSTETRLRQLDIENERIARLIPRRNVETWILALNDILVDEEHDFKRTRVHREWRMLVRAASNAFYTLSLSDTGWPYHLPDSLRHGLKEVQRIFN